jgi:amidophosphoribosyltransferase
VGVLSKTGKNVAPLIYRGLLALQHRGQDSTGIAIFDGNSIKMKKSKGLVSTAFDDKDLMIEGNVGIGHTRYRTVGLSRDCDIQPFGDGAICIAHNGQIANSEELRRQFFHSDQFESSVDSELFLHAIRQKISEGIDQCVQFIMQNFDGAYSTVALIEGKLVVFRDRFGLRPLVYGENSDFMNFAIR